MKKIINQVLTIVIGLCALVSCAQNSAGKEGQLTTNNYEETQTIVLSDSGTTFSGSGISIEGDNVKITKAGSYSLSGILSDSSVIVDTKETVFLILNGVDITNTQSSAINFINMGKVVIEIADGTENRLSDGEEKIKKKDTDADTNAVIYSNSNIELHGGGKLYIKGNNRGGIHSNNKIDIYSGVLNISAKQQGIFAQNSLIVHDGEINIEQSKEGMECKSELIINDGHIQIISKDDALNAGDSIVINGGYIYADSGGDGFDSNGNMTINSGEIYIFAKKQKSSGLDVSDGSKIGKFTINGGTVVAAGNGDPITVERSSKQGYTWLYPQEPFVGSASVVSNNGEEIIGFTFLYECELVFISVETIKSSETYMLINDTR